MLKWKLKTDIEFETANKTKGEAEKWKLISTPRLTINETVKQ